MKKDKNKKLQKAEKKETALIRSSAAEYLTFVAAAGSSETSVEMRYEDEDIWLTQKMIATLYRASVLLKLGTLHGLAFINRYIFYGSDSSLTAQAVFFTSVYYHEEINQGESGLLLLNG